jgi:hypothetical protein
MNPADMARELLLAAAASLLGSRLYIEVSSPGPHDDAALELAEDRLQECARAYVAALGGKHP